MGTGSFRSGSCVKNEYGFGSKPQSLLERFVSKIRITPGCWIWAGSYRDRYGSICINKKTFKASRVSWEIFRGPIPGGLFVLHSCDNPKCVRPSHLFLGTHLDNMKDRDGKGRQPRGETQSGAKLTNRKVLEIRRRHQAGESSRSLAKKFKVCQRTILDASKKHKWKHV